MFRSTFIRVIPPGEDAKLQGGEFLAPTRPDQGR
jgi:hypothetical protein